MGFDWNNFWRASRGFLDSQVPGLGAARGAFGSGSGSGYVSGYEGEIDRAAQPYIGGGTDIVPLVLIGVALFALTKVRL